MIEKPLYRYGSLDSGSLCRLFRNDDVYFPSSDDHTNPIDAQRFIDNCLRSEVMYILGRDPRFEAFIFAPSHNGTTYQAHLAVRKDKRDGSTVRKAAEAGKWVFENTTCRSIITFVRAENLGIRSVLGQLGMKKVGEIPESVKFNGEYMTEFIYYGTVKDFNALWGDTLGRI